MEHSFADRTLETVLLSYSDSLGGLHLFVWAAICDLEILHATQLCSHKTKKASGLFKSSWTRLQAPLEGQLGQLQGTLSFSNEA